MSPSRRPPPRPKGGSSLEHVAFRYVADKPLIQDFNLDVLPGETVAIVGPTGAGKTTIVNLLMRFYEINSGHIFVDGVDINMLPRERLRSMFGMVLQDTWLFAGSIRDNIAYGRDGATTEDVVAAGRAAYVDQFVRTLPDGYDTVLDEDASNISSGQRQLITIARAFLAAPAILILDEATSNVDTRTEVLIQEAMARLRAGAHELRHRPPAVDDPQRGLDRGHGRRPDRRGGQSRGPARTPRLLLRPVLEPVLLGARSRCGGDAHIRVNRRRIP